MRSCLLTKLEKQLGARAKHEGHGGPWPEPDGGDKEEALCFLAAMRKSTDDVEGRVASCVACTTVDGLDKSRVERTLLEYVYTTWHLADVACTVQCAHASPP